MARGRRKNPAGGTALGGVVVRLKGLGYASPAYRLTLGGRAPDRLLLQPADMLPGDASRGSALLENRYAFAGQEVTAAAGPRPGVSQDGPPWRHTEAGEFWFRELHSFDWLRDLQALATQASRARARKLVLHWLDLHTAIDPRPWSPDLLGRRVTAWLAHAEFLLKDSDSSFSKRFFRGLALQARHLSRTARNGEDGAERLLAYKGLLYSGLSLPDGERRAQQALKLLAAELGRQILPDGGHFERSPSAHLSVLRHLIDIRGSLIAAGQPAPEALNNAIDRMAPVLRAYRHGDGALALFNDSVENEPWLIDLVLAQCAAKGRAQDNAPHTGFRRVQAGRSLLITDLGAPARSGRRVHAGMLSFELSAGKERLIVNCGAWRGDDDNWRKALRATAAHSTLTVNDTNSCELFDDGSIGAGPTRFESQREDQEGASWLEAGHDGYRAPFGLIHRRRLYVAPDGNNLRGEDILMRADAANRGGRSFAIRFHLHPDVQASLVQDGGSVLLRPPSGNGWQIRAGGGTIGLNESVYTGDGLTRRRSEQVIITGPVEAEETVIKWALRRIPKN
ncbi:MAG: heparinase II/III family protein [Alphaproteobacteria bacterium]|nr:heparinase II/III family protein [Alphaproteobacteria bacterium]